MRVFSVSTMKDNKFYLIEGSEVKFFKGYDAVYVVSREFDIKEFEINDFEDEYLSQYAGKVVRMMGDTQKLKIIESMGTLRLLGGDDKELAVIETLDECETIVAVIQQNGTMTIEQFYVGEETVSSVAEYVINKYKIPVVGIQ